MIYEIAMHHRVLLLDFPLRESVKEWKKSNSLNLLILKSIDYSIYWISDLLDLMLNSGSDELQAMGLARKIEVIRIC
jgi:hypothetical protein